MTDATPELGADPDSSGAASTEVDEQQYFAFRVGQTLLATLPTNIDRVLQKTRPVRIPTAPTHVLGVVHLQGRIITVVNLRAALGVRSTPTTTAEARTVVLRAQGGVFATDVDQVLGLLSTPKNELREPERTESELQRAVYVNEYAAPDGVVTVLDVERLFQELSQGNL